MLSTKRSVFITVIISLFSINVLIMSAPAPKVCDGSLRVYLTISSLANESIRQLEMHWRGATPQAGDWIGIFSSDPNNSQPLPPSLSVADPAGQCDGWIRTQIVEEGRPNASSSLGFQPKCLDYYIGYIRDNSIVLKSNCLRLEPTWMSERPGLGILSMSTIFIPGSHDTGAYGEYNPITGETKITKYTETQDEDVLSQLIRGIRYLDIRVGYYRYLRRRSNESLSGYWITHGAFKMHPFETVTAQIREFLNNTPSQEIVIFDVQEFTNGFNFDEDHDDFIAFLEREFQGYYIPSEQTYDWTTKISDLWATKGRIIVSYDNSAAVSRNPWLWPNCQHMWGNVRTLDDLYTYLADVQINHPMTRAWAAMAELTPSATDVVTDVLGGLRVMADSVNRNVTDWYWGAWGETVNIVAVDYFRGTDIVQAALSWNDKRIVAKKAMLSVK